MCLDKLNRGLRNVASNLKIHTQFFIQLFDYSVIGMFVSPT